MAPDPNNPLLGQVARLDTQSAVERLDQHEPATAAKVLSALPPARANRILSAMSEESRERIIEASPSGSEWLTRCAFPKAPSAA